MSSEALREANAWLEQLASADRELVRTSGLAAALLAEVARLEQERDEASESTDCHAAIDLLARVPYESGLELGELIEERRAALQDRGLLPASEGLGVDTPAPAPANDLWQKIQDQRAANAKLQRKYETAKGSLAAAEVRNCELDSELDAMSARHREVKGKLRVALAVAREREQRATGALEAAAEKLDVLRRMAVNSRTAPNVFESIADVAMWARDDARAALVDEPAADESLTEEGGVNESSSGVHGQQMSPLPSPENDRSGRSSARTSPPAVSDSPAAAMLAEPDDKPCVAQDGPSAPQTAAFGSASAAADKEQA